MKMKTLLSLGLFALLLFSTTLQADALTAPPNLKSSNRQIIDSPDMEELFTTRAWALEAGFFHRIAPVALERLRLGHDLSVFKRQGDDMHMALVAGRDELTGLPYYKSSTGENVASIPVIGTMTKYGGMSAMGSQQIAAAIQKANASPNIKSIVMVFDGPGGAVDGTPELGINIRQSQKPIVGFVDGMAASAHYWTASQATYLVGNSQNYTEVGSIGVLTMLMNQQQWLVQQGKEVKIMRAEQSVDKALLNSVEPWPQEALDKLQLELNMIADDFKATVTDGRGDRLNTGSEDIFTGKMYDLGTAIELGMVDFAMTLQETIDFAAQVGAARNT